MIKQFVFVLGLGGGLLVIDLSIYLPTFVDFSLDFG
jgi:hypothetical protein